MDSSFDKVRDGLRNSPARAACFFGFWLILSGFSPADIFVGALAAIAATWASLRLLPPGRWTFRPLALAGFTLRFVRQSIGAGIDVAWRALDPRMPLRPGLVVYQSRLPPGPTRDAFCTLTSLLPGTLPCGSDEEGSLLIHCLDVAQPVVEQLKEEEVLFVRVLGAGGDNG